MFLPPLLIAQMGENGKMPRQELKLTSHIAYIVFSPPPSCPFVAVKNGKYVADRILFVGES
jgi:hypothetical protein